MVSDWKLVISAAMVAVVNGGGGKVVDSVSCECLVLHIIVLGCMFAEIIARCCQSFFSP